MSNLIVQQLCWCSVESYWINNQKVLKGIQRNIVASLLRFNMLIKLELC